ncbi:hypothetical protein I7I48_04361 [Histoplasma ohiense]|nr:hypothetical protein I7I48_04361 [Histoplasma ohiense (nom. inval.)]
MVSIDCNRYQQDVGPPASDAGVCHVEPRNLETLLPPNHVSISRDLTGQVGFDWKYERRPFCKVAG